ncbi:MAG: type II secretion system F family protein [Actinomycetota bacterium]
MSSDLQTQAAGEKDTALETRSSRKLKFAKPANKEAKPKPFSFRALVKDENGKTKVIRFKSLSRAQARQYIVEKGYELEQIRQLPPLGSIEIGGRVPLKTLLHFTRQLASFSTAGISVLDALALLANESKNPRMKNAITSMIFDVREGDSLARAAASHPDVFPEYYVAILHSAERSGDLAESTETLAGYLERDVTSVRAIQSALFYPAILLAVGVFAAIVITVVVLPKFQELFNSLAVTLPPATQLLLDISAFMSTYWTLITALIVAIVAFIFIIRRTRSGALATDRLVLRIPIIGKLLNFIALERFSRILGSLMNAGVPLTDSLKLSSGVTGNKAYEKAALEIRDGVLRGDGLSAPMEQSKMFPPETVQMFKVGENSGRLAEQLNHSARYYASEVDYRLKNLTSLIEPVILIVIGGGVGFIAVALISAMYGIYSGSEVGGV